MDDRQLMSQQKDIAENIKKDIDEGKTKFVIRGVSGCGKSYVSAYIIEYLNKSLKKPVFIHLQGDEQCINREYYPFSYGLRKLADKYTKNKIIKKTIPKAFDFSPLGGDFLGYISEIIVNKLSSKELFLNQLFNDVELDIVLTLKKLANNASLIIYLDNLHWWDEKSLTLLYLLLEHSQTYIPGLENATFICNITDDQFSSFTHKIEQLINTFDFISYQFIEISIEEYVSFIKCLNPTKIENSRWYEFLYKITGGHLEVTKKAILYEDGTLFDEIDEDSPNSGYIYLNRLIERRLENFGATGEQIDEVLQFASLLGMSFTLYELEHILNSDSYSIKSIIEKAQNICLIDSQSKQYQFSHEIIHELFERKTLNNKYYYYPKIIECFKQLYPTNYTLRIRYLLIAGEIKEIEKLYVLDVIQQIQKTGTYTSNTQIEILLSDDYKNFLFTIKKGIQNYQNSQYIQAANTIKNTDIYNFDLCAVRDMLLAQCYTKILDEEKRMEAVELLSAYSDAQNKFKEKHLWLTCMLSLLDANIHIGCREDSRKLAKRLSSFCAEFTENCEWYRYQLNILRRKSMAIFELEISKLQLEKSIHFFEKNNSAGFLKYPIDYYITLVNYASVLICCGDFKKAHSTNQAALELQHKYSELKFPRSEILINNFFMSGILCGEITIDTAIKNMKSLLKNLDITADIYFLKSNLGIYYIMQGDLIRAQELLEPIHTEASNKKIREYSYYYHAETNLAIIFILKKDWEKAEMILKSLDDMVPEIHYSSFYKKRHELLKKIVTDKEEYEQEDFADALFVHVPQYQTPAWRYFGIAYSFNTLEHWGES